MVSREDKSPEPGDLTEMLAKVHSAGVNRRRFLKGAGIGSLALASLPTVGSALARKAFAGDLLAFHLVTVSGVHDKRDLLVVAGGGQFHGSHVSGWGRWFHFLAPIEEGGDPEPVAHGTWSPKELTSFNTIGSAFGIAAGILDLVISGFVVESGATPTFPFRIVCNVPPAGLLTGLNEGLYRPGHPAGDFEPLHPELGLTAFLEM